MLDAHCHTATLNSENSHFTTHVHALDATIPAEGRHARASDTQDTHDLRRGSRFDGHGRAAPAAKRENLEELEEQKFCRSSDARRSPGSKLVCSNSCITTPV